MMTKFEVPLFVPEGAARPASMPQPAAKRVLDIFVSVAMLVLLAPVLLVVGLAVRLSSRGPALYRCPRVGKDGRVFHMLKFRKMRRGAGGPPLTLAGDGRLTSVGRFLASSRLDELPQLVNVLRGEMSLVGPRPEDPTIVALRPEAFRDVLRARPGITGVSQLVFNDETRLLDAQSPLQDYLERLLPEKLRLDRVYVANRSIAQDLRILAWTGGVVLLGWRVSADSETGRLVRVVPVSGGAR